MRIERRLGQPWWLTVVVPVVSIAAALVLSAVVLLLTGHPPVKSLHRLFDAAFIAHGALSETIVSATPLAFTGLAAAVAFRMNLFNIGGEGQLYAGAIMGAAAGLLLAGTPSPLVIAGMIAAGAAGGALLAAIPAVLKAFFSTNEIITSLMLNYVIGLVLEYLIFDSHSYLRDTSGFEASVFPQGKTLPDEATWSSWTVHGLMLPLGFVLAIAVAVGVWVLYSRTRFGFEVQVIGDSARAGRYAGMRTRRKILAVMCLSGAIAGSRRREPDGRLQASARSARSPSGELRLYGHRRRRAGALQPVRRRRRGAADRRLDERRLHVAGRRLPRGARRRDAGPDPLLRARRRVVCALPREVRLVNNSIVVVVLASGVLYGTPLLYAALGELLAERAGVLNLGVEGMMLMGAVMGFWTVERVDGPKALVLLAAIGVAALAGAVMAAIHAFLVITLRANQIVSGLALTIFAGAAGLSSYLGNDLQLSGKPARYQFQEVFPNSLQNLPVIGPIVFGQSLLVYASWICVIVVALYLTRTRLGLNLRAVGESPAAADAMGVSVPRYRYAHTLVGGAFAGVGGAAFSLSITPQWVDGLTQGAGWIAIALVIFAFWRPTLCLLGAYFFGAFTALPFALQGHGVTVAPELFQTLPYVATIVALVLVSSRAARLRFGAPAALGVPYVREER